MTKRKSTKRALLLSALSLLMCVSMLIGSTFAWFTDSVTSAGNKIQAGTLKIDLELLTDEGFKSIKESKTALFNYDKWEPGYTEVKVLKVENEGNLALKWVAKFTSETELSELANVIDVYVLPSATELTMPTGRDLTGYTKVGTVAQFVNTIEETTKGILLPKDDEGKGGVAYLGIALKMQETAGNDYQGLSLGGEFDITIFATQYTYESDSFGPDYDNGAYIPVAPEAIPDNTADGLELEGSKESKVKVNVPAAVLNGLDEEVTSLTVAASAPVIDTANKTVSFPTIELQDQNGKEVDLSDANAKVTVTLSVNNVFAEGEQVEVYHDGAFVTYATVTNGYISYEVSHFCEVEIKAAEEIVLDNTIDTVKEFIAFAAAVNAGNSYKGQTVVLGADLDLAGVTWTPIGTSSNPFKGTFDGNGKVIKNLSVLMAGKNDVGLFGFTTDGEVKNVTVENAKVAGRLNIGVVAGTPYTTKYNNITVKGQIEVDGLAYVGAVGGKNAYANWNNITVNAAENSYVKAHSIENGKAYRTYVGGVVGFNGEGGHTFSNITSNINVYGSTCDVGGAFGIAHYGNKFENVTVTGNVEIYKAEEAADADEMGGIAGVWHNKDGQTVSFTNCTFTGKLSANVAADLYNNTITGAAYNKTDNGTLVIDGKAYAAVNTGDELKAALTENKNVIFVDNITMAATESNAYGKTGINVKSGQAIDGNGFTLKVTGAGATWASAISTTGGIIKNLTVAQGFRGIFVNHNSTYSDTVVLDNVTIQGPTYTISCDQGMKQNLVATNCTINGWTSYAATIGTATFTNCSFGYGAGYQFARPYAPTEFVNCTFSEGYTIDTSKATVTFTGCENPNK